ncbi:MAG: LysR family transcriptional regulator [Actinomycetota bacterium]
MNGRKRLANRARLPFDLWALEVFVSVCETGAMTSAAALVGVTQAGVSQTISDLEKCLATPLFDRSARPLKLTPAGIVLRDHARLLLAQAHSVSTDVHEIGAGRLPAISVGVVDSMERVAIPALSSFLPTVARSCSILSGLTQNHVHSFLKHEIDMIVGVAALDSVEGVKRQELLSEPYVIILPRTLPAPAESELVATLSSWPMVRYSARSFTGAEVERLLRRQCIEAPHRLELDRPFGVTTAVADGQGWAITTPLCLFQAGIPPDDWRCLPLPTVSRRRVTLASRVGGFARVGTQVADVLRSSLESRFFPWIDQYLPELAGEVSLTRAG